MTTSDIIDEFADIITSSPPLEAIAEYRLSDQGEAYINSLLENNQNGQLTAEAQAELDYFIFIEHMMLMVKFKAIEKLEQAK